MAQPRAYGTGHHRSSVRYGAELRQARVQGTGHMVQGPRPPAVDIGYDRGLTTPVT